MQCVHKESVVCVKVYLFGASTRRLSWLLFFDLRVVVVITNFLGENTNSLTKKTGTSVRMGSCLEDPV